MAFQCTQCDRSFPKAHGLATHISLKHNRSNGKPRGQVKQILRSVLEKNPEGMDISEIEQEMKKDGWRPSGSARSYISQTAAADPDIVRIERGRYRLKPIKSKRIKNHLLPESRDTAVAEISQQDIPRETLLLRIQTLESTVNGLRDAHMALLRSLTVSN